MASGMTADRLNVCLKSGLCLLFYAVCSISITFYQKHLLHDLGFPLSIVMAHLIIKFLIAALLRNYMEATYDEQRCTLPWRVYLRQLTLPGVASALDIGCSQWSIQFISVALYTMTKSTAVIWIYICALCLRIEKLQWSMAVVVASISTGLILFTYKSTTFDFIGFLLALVAAIVSGLRWTVSQVVVQRSDLGLGNPIDMVYHIQPLMIAALVPFAVFFEGVKVASSRDLFLFAEPSVMVHSAGRIMLGCLLAFALDVSEFLALRVTSSVTLCVAGVAKEIATLLIAIRVNGEELGSLRGVGLVICVAGIVLHGVKKALHLRAVPPPSCRPQHKGWELPLLGAARDDDDEEDEEDVLFQTSR